MLNVLEYKGYSSGLTKFPYLKNIAKALVTINGIIELIDDEKLKDFGDYIYTKVKLIKNTTPEKIDLNKLFSTINSAGVQLEQTDIIKANLLYLIDEKVLYSKIWEACENTNNFFERTVRDSFPKTDWAKKEDAPGSISVLVKAAGVPIDRYSGEQIDQLKDIEARWKLLRKVRETASFDRGSKKDRDVAKQYVSNVPDAEIYPIEVSFSELDDAEERQYLNQLPTSFRLDDADVDKLRAAAGKIILKSPDFQRLLKDMGANVIQRK
jgi:hypothetical protein